MNEEAQRALDMLAALFMGMPALVFVAVVVALAGLAVWLGRRVWVFSNILMVVGSAREVGTASGATGLVKLRGRAHGLPPPPGLAPQRSVWAEHKSSWSTGSSRTSSSAKTVGRFLIVDAAGACSVDADRTEVVPTTSNFDNGFLDRDRWSSSAEIARDDPVFALGRLHALAPDQAGARHARCELRPARGVMLVSGAPEREVRVLYALWWLVQAPLLGVSLAVLGWGVWCHLVSYPDSDPGRVGHFVQTLLSDPFLPEPGWSHPDWPAAADVPDGTAAHESADPPEPPASGP